MSNHLNDEQMTEMLLTDGDAAVMQHLAGCEACRCELERMRAALASVRAELVARAERPALFWREQYQAITSRIPAGREIGTRPLAWAGSLAMVAIAAAWLTQSAPPAPSQVSRTHDAASVSAPVDPDHALLVDIQRSVRRDVPRALEPATLLAQELHRAANRKSDR